jgi:hypothetical protein
MTFVDHAKCLSDTDRTLSNSDQNSLVCACASPHRAGLRRVPLEIDASHSPDQHVLWISRDSGG